MDLADPATAPATSSSSEGSPASDEETIAQIKELQTTLKEQLAAVSKVDRQIRKMEAGLVELFDNTKKGAQELADCLKNEHEQMAQERQRIRELAARSGDGLAVVQGVIEWGFKECLWPVQGMLRDCVAKHQGEIHPCLARAILSLHKAMREVRHSAVVQILPEDIISIAGADDMDPQDEYSREEDAFRVTRLKPADGIFHPVAASPASAKPTPREQAADGRSQDLAHAEGNGSTPTAPWPRRRVIGDAVLNERAKTADVDLATLMGSMTTAPYSDLPQRRLLPQQLRSKLSQHSPKPASPQIFSQTESGQASRPMLRRRASAGPMMLVNALPLPQSRACRSPMGLIRRPSSGACTPTGDSPLLVQSSSCLSGSSTPGSGKRRMRSEDATIMGPSQAERSAPTTLASIQDGRAALDAALGGISRGSVATHSQSNGVALFIGDLLAKDSDGPLKRRRPSVSSRLVPREPDEPTPLTRRSSGADTAVLSDAQLDEALMRDAKHSEPRFTGTRFQANAPTSGSVQLGVLDEQNASAADGSMIRTPPTPLAWPDAGKSRGSNTVSSMAIPPAYGAGRLRV